MSNFTRVSLLEYRDLSRIFLEKIFYEAGDGIYLCFHEIDIMGKDYTQVPLLGPKAILEFHKISLDSL